MFNASSISCAKAVASRRGKVIMTCTKAHDPV